MSSSVTSMIFAVLSLAAILLPVTQALLDDIDVLGNQNIGNEVGGGYPRGGMGGPPNRGYPKGGMGGPPYGGYPTNEGNGPFNRGYPTSDRNGPFDRGYPVNVGAPAPYRGGGPGPKKGGPGPITGYPTGVNPGPLNRGGPGPINGVGPGPIKGENPIGDIIGPLNRNNGDSPLDGMKPTKDGMKPTKGNDGKGIDDGGLLDPLLGGDTGSPLLDDVDETTDCVLKFLSKVTKLLLGGLKNTLDILKNEKAPGSIVHVVKNLLDNLNDHELEPVFKTLRNILGKLVGN